MRHQRAGLHLSRSAAHRKALFSNLVSALLTHERIRTTDAKAKETRRIAERTITWARRLGDVLEKKPERRTPAEQARFVHAVRMAGRVVRNRDAVLKLFSEIGPRYLSRQGGYTRIVKIGQRPGDAAPISLLELIPDEASGPVKKRQGEDESDRKGGKSAKPSAAAKKEAAPKSAAAKAGGTQARAKAPSTKKAAGADSSTEGGAKKTARAKKPTPQGK